MNFKEKIKKKENCIWALCFTVILCGVLALFFDYYFDINDDMLMRDFVSGVYAGRPSGYNIQMLYPLSFLLSLPYHIFSKIHWYDLFFLVSQYGCIYLITNRLLDFCRSRLCKVLVILVETGIILITFLGELVFIQYTVTSALMAMTVAFLIYTNDVADTPRAFFKENKLSFALIILSFMVRPNLLLLMFPFVCVVGICKWATEVPIFSKNNFKKYFSFLGVVVGSIVILQVIHEVAYGGEDWKEFFRFFDNRTEIYDYHKVPSYNENVEFYESIGLNENDCRLLLNFYNVGLDETLDSAVMEKIKDYVVTKDSQKQSVIEGIKTAFSDYRYRTFSKRDYPYSWIVIVLYGLVFIAALCNRHFRFIWEETLLGVVRSGIWMFILFRGRVPERIIHPLYLIEILILIAFLLVELRALNEKKHSICYQSIGVLCGLLLFFFIGSYCRDSVNAVLIKYKENQKLDVQYNALLEYIREHKNNFYFFDIFSVSEYKTKLFDDQIGEINNYEMLGGWAAKNPLSKEKYQAFSFSTVEDGLVERDNVYFVLKNSQAYHPNIEKWLEEYYADRGRNVYLKQIDGVIADGDIAFIIYKIVDF